MKWLLTFLMFSLCLAQAQGQTLTRSPAFQGAAARPATGGGGGSGYVFTYIGGGTNDPGSGFDCQYSATVGRLIIFFAKWEGTGTLSAVTNNASGSQDSLTALTQTDHNNGDIHTRIFWKVIENSGGTIFTGTYTGSPTFVRTRVLEFSISGGTVSVDASVLPTSPNTSGTSFTTSGGGTLSTSVANSLVVCGYSEYTSGLPTSPQIGGSAATMFPDDTSHGSSQLWYRILTSTISGASGTATVPNSSWIGQLVAFKSL